MMWQENSLTHDGRSFEINSLQPSDDPDVVLAVSEARAALIEQVKHKNVFKNKIRTDTFSFYLNTVLSLIIFVLV